MPRTGMKGFELCPHTCAPTGHCLNRSQTPLWRIEGGSLRRHLKLQRHSGCSESCPAYGITDCHDHERVVATPAQLQAYIPLIRKLRKISDDIISRSLLIDLSEVARRFPVGGDDSRNGKKKDEDDTDEEETEDRDPHTDVEANWDMNIDDDDNNERKGRGDVEGMLVDHNQPDQMDDSDDEYGRPPEDSQKFPKDEEVEMDANGPENLFQPPSAIFTDRAPSIGSEVSGLSGDTQFSDLFDRPDVRLTIQNRPPIHKTFRVLYIADPSRHVTDVSGTWIDLSFTTRTITKQQFQDASSVFPQLIFHRSQGRIRNRDMVKARLSEWLWLMMRFSTLKVDGRKIFDISYMSWSTFKDGILTLDENVITRLLSVDCIIGGVDYTINYSALYDWRNNKELESYLYNIENIRPPLRFWPPLHQVKYAGMKHKVIMDLSMIAVYNKTFRPTTAILKKSSNSPIPKDAVLKRSNSDCGHHVIMPSDTEKRTWEYLLSQTRNQETWVAQEYIPTLVEFGEWRVFIVKGQIHHVVHTWKTDLGRWSGRVMLSYWNLEELWYMLRKSRTASVPINQEDIHRADEGHIKTRQAAKQQFWSFVEKTYQSLVDYEMRRQLGTPSISVFCRMDIGVIERDNSLHYFVNEVERTTTASLWVDAFPTGHGILADSIGVGIYEWLANEIIR